MFGRKILRMNRPAFALALALSLLWSGGWSDRGQGELSAKRRRPAAGKTPVKITDQSIRKSLVIVRISTIYPDYRRPWVKEAGQNFSVVGLVLPGKRILMLANDARHAGLLEVRKFSSYRRSIAKVALLDMESNLAILKVDEPGFFKDLVPLAAGETPLPGANISAVKVDNLFRVYRERAQVMEVNPVADFGFTFLPVAVVRTNEPFRQGGLLICGNIRVCGFIGYTDQEKRAEAIPGSTMNAFRKRATGARYAGFVAQGFEVAGVVDPVLREYYKLTADLKGPLVTRVLPGTSSWGTLQKDDVLLSIDGVRLDNQGFYEDPFYGRQHAGMLLARDSKNRLRIPGQTVGVVVFRGGKRVSLKMSLRAYRGGAERIKWMLNDTPPYLVESGLVFLELSVPFLKRVYGARWRTASIELAHLYKTRRFYQKPDDERIVILALVLPDGVNRGYEAMGEAPVETLNGRPLRNLKHMHELLKELADSGQKVVTLGLPGGRKIYLDLENRNRVNTRIKQRYNLPRISTWD